VTYDEVRDLLIGHLARSQTDSAGAHEIYRDDAILEFPQSGERFRGKAKILAFRERYPARVHYEPRELRGSGDFWVGEGRVVYDGGDPIHFAWIVEFRDGLVQRETIYFAAPFRLPNGAGHGPRRTQPG
jgi:hypothetical protein